jgi:ligand-binding sensor domain-containing protein
MKTQNAFIFLLLFVLTSRAFSQATGTASTSSSEQKTDDKIVVFQTIIVRDGSLWTATNLGAFHIQLSGKTVKYSKKEGLNDDFVGKVYQGIDNTMWFIHSGTYSWGPSTINSANGVSHLKNDGTIEIFAYGKKLPTGFVNCISFGTDGSIWFGTNSGVVQLLKDGKTKEFDTSTGLLSNRIRDITIDKQNQLYFSTENGISKLGSDGKITNVSLK